MKEVKHYLMAFLLPILIYCIVMASLDFYPFGNLSFRISDSLVQYPAFFEGLKNFHFFTFNIGLGMNFYPILTTYLMCPLNLLYFFFKKENFDLFFVILILLKVGLIGLTMNILLNYKRKYSYKSLIFSTIYALSGFVTLYYFNYQFLDAVYMLPLVMIGLQKLVKENKYTMYYIALSLTIIMHYYTGYMVCLFSLIYFFYLLYNEEIEKKEKRKRIKTFFGISLLCGLSASFVLIPTAFSFMQGRSDYFSINNIFKINSDIISSIYNFSIGSLNTTDLMLDSAATYISFFVIIIIIYGLTNKNVNSRLRKSVILILVIYFLSLAFYLLYYCWHLFQLPVGNPGRFVFVFDAFLVNIAYQFFQEQKLQVTLKKKIATSLIVIFVFFLTLLGKNYLVYTFFWVYKDYTFVIILLNLFVVTVYVLLITNKRWKNFVFFIVFLELIANVTWSFRVTLSYENYNKTIVSEEDEKIKNLSNTINNLEYDGFTRIDGYYKHNNGLLYNYSSASYFSSIYNKNFNTFIDEYVKKRSNPYKHVYYHESDFALDAFLGIKYIIDNQNKNKETRIYENQNVIKSLGFLVNPKNNSNLSDASLTDILNVLTGDKYKLSLKKLQPKITLNNVKKDMNLLKPIDDSTDGIVIFEYYIPEDCYANFNYGLGQRYPNLQNGLIFVVDDLVKETLNGKETSYYQSELKKGDVLKIEVTIPVGIKYIINEYEDAYYVKKQNFIDAINDLNQSIIENIKINKNGFTGNFKATNEKNFLILTIPYDENIIIKVDGNKQNYSKILNGIIGLDVSEGEHEIEFMYNIKGLNIGIVISLLSLLTVILLNFKRKK